MATLYVTEPGARLEKEYKRLRVVSKDRETLLLTPLSRVSEVALVGWAGATTPAILSLLDAGIGLSFLTRGGKLRGRLTPPTGKNVALRRQQYIKTEDPAFCLNLSKQVVNGKLRNSRVMARRMLRRNINAPPGQLERIIQALKAAPHCRNSQTLMSQEGSGAKGYFAILRAALNKQLSFGRRSRRPPRDPANALLSFGYGLLSANIISALEIVGLDPYCGYFHAQAYGRPALALDLMEEFRPIIADSVLLTLVNKKMLTENDFEAARGGASGIYLTRRGRKVFLAQYTHRLQTNIYHPLAGRALSYQKIFEIQARQIAKLIKEEIDLYKPFVVR